MVYLQRDGIVDPIIRKSLFEVPGTDKFVLSAAALFHSAAAFFNKNETDDGNTRLVEHFPALTLKRREEGPNGKQTYEVRTYCFFEPQNSDEVINIAIL